MQKEKLLAGKLRNIFYNEKEDDILVEAIPNCHEQHISSKEIEKLTIKAIEKFLKKTEVMAQQKVTILKKSMYFYAWIDSQSPGIHYSFVSSVYKQLPFATNHIIIEDLKTASEIFFYELKKASAEISLRKFSDSGTIIVVNDKLLCEHDDNSYIYVYQKALSGAA